MEIGKRMDLKGLEDYRLQSLKMRSERKRQEEEGDGVCQRMFWGS